MGRVKGCEKHPNSVKKVLPISRQKIRKTIRFERQHVEVLGIRTITKIARNAVEFHFNLTQNAKE